MIVQDPDSLPTGGGSSTVTQTVDANGNIIQNIPLPTPIPTVPATIVNPDTNSTTGTLAQYLVIAPNANGATVEQEGNTFINALSRNYIHDSMDTVAGQLFQFTNTSPTIQMIVTFVIPPEISISPTSLTLDVGQTLPLQMSFNTTNINNLPAGTSQINLGVNVAPGNITAAPPTQQTISTPQTPQTPVVQTSTTPVTSPVGGGGEGGSIRGQTGNTFTQEPV